MDLTPDGATESAAYDVYSGLQVGYARVGGVTRASLWTGSSASWVDLHPAGASYSVAHDVYAGQQVGDAWVGGYSHASLWSNSAASWVDLHTFLPPQFTSSSASGIWSDENFTYVAGYGRYVPGGPSEAFLWIAPVPEPASGLVLVAGLSVLALFRRRSHSDAR